MITCKITDQITGPVQIKVTVMENYEPDPKTEQRTIVMLMRMLTTRVQSYTVRHFSAQCMANKRKHGLS